MAAGNTFSRGPPRMERGRGGVGGGYRGNRGGGAFNPMNPAQPMAFAGYEAKGAALVYQSALLQTAGRLKLTGMKEMVDCLLVFVFFILFFCLYGVGCLFWHSKVLILFKKFKFYVN